MIRLKQTGDTIVEVLIAIVVITTMMSGAFLSTRRSASGTRQSQERVEGLKAAEEQAERLKVLAVLEPDPLKDPSPTKDYFCIDRSGLRRDTSGPLPALDADTFNSSNYYTDIDPTKTCPREPVGGVTYYPAIVRNLATNTFIVHVRWAKAGGSGNEEVTLAYRIHP